MPSRSAITATDVIIGAMILLAIVIAAVAVTRLGHRGERPGGPPQSPGDDRASTEKIDPALIHYQQTAAFPVQMKEVRALAVGPDDRIYVAGDKAIDLLPMGSTAPPQIPLDGEPQCLAVGPQEHAGPGHVYVGMKDHVELLDTHLKPTGAWPSLGEKAQLTSIAVAEQDVFVADAGNRIVWHYDTAGKLKGRIGEPDTKRNSPGFLITDKSYFDLALSPEGLLCVVNPRALRIESYTFRGDRESFWGKGASGIEGFFGCCNPVHFAVLSDGRFVTAEKGIPVVKIYSRQGEFVCVVSGPEQVPVAAADVAADGRDRVLILDPRARSVRIFEPKPPSSGGSDD